MKLPNAGAAVVAREKIRDYLLNPGHPDNGGKAAFFPDKSAWEKLSRALKGSVEKSAFEALSGTTSIPFKPRERKTVAVKVIDPRGNEVMKVHRIGREVYSET